MPGPVFLDGEDVTLRPAEQDDFAFVQRNRNHPDVRASRSIYLPTFRGQLEHRYEQVTAGESDSVSLLACADEEPVGTVSLWRQHRNDDVYKRAELAYWIAPEEWGNGYATAASRLLVGHGFDRLNLHKVIARTFAFNEASQRVLEKVGFTEEGTLRNEAFVDGKYVDLYRYGLLEDEWATDEARP